MNEVKQIFICCDAIYFLSFFLIDSLFKRFAHLLLRLIFLEELLKTIKEIDLLSAI